MSEPVLAIDFGTTTSAAILVTASGQEAVEEPAGRGRTWPSAVFYDGDSLLVGSTAYAGRRSRPERYRAEFKPELGSGVPIPLGGRGFAVTELVTAVLGEIRATAERAAGTGITRAVLTVPAGHDAYDERGALMIEAADAAGLRTVELLAEPVAAAFAPIAGEPPAPGSLVLVYDLGGGTFDAALVRPTGGQAWIGEGVLGRTGLAVGGRDIDAALYDELAGSSGRRLDPLLGTPRARMRMAELVGELKHRLTDAATADDYFGDSDILITATRDQLSALATPFLLRTVEAVRELLDGCGVAPDEVDSVLLVGGATRMPVVARTVERLLGRPVRSARWPELAVVQGAARFAAGADARFAAPWACPPKERPLRWRIPGDCATLLEWAVSPGKPFTAGQALARVRLTGGAIWELRAAELGCVAALHASPGAAVHSGDWLVTTITDPFIALAALTGREMPRRYARSVVLPSCLPGPS